MAAAPNSPAYRAELLSIAAALSKPVWPTLRGSFAHQDSMGRSKRYTWVVRYPGALVVFDSNSGVIEACSKPGQPFTLAPAEEWAE